MLVQVLLLWIGSIHESSSCSTSLPQLGKVSLKLFGQSGECSVVSHFGFLFLKVFFFFDVDFFFLKS